jgi:hypothetical protein
MAQNPLYKIVRLTETGGVCSEGRIMRVIVFGGDAATSVIFTDGTTTFEVNCPIAVTRDVDLTGIGGIFFASDVEATISGGTGPIVTVFCDAGDHA